MEKIINEIIISLYLRKIAPLSYFSQYELNQTNNTIPLPNFIKSIRELCPDASFIHIDFFAKEISFGSKTSVSYEEFDKIFQEYSQNSIEIYENQMVLKIKECLLYKKINLRSNLRKLDTYKANEIPQDDFFKELQQIFGANLTDNHYKYILRKYGEIASLGKINYVKFCEDVVPKKQEKMSSETENIAGSNILNIYMSKMREYMHAKNIKIYSELMSEKIVEKHDIVELLLRLFPECSLAKDEFIIITNSYEKEKLLEELWTDENEENIRPYKEKLAKELNYKIYKYCNSHNLKLKEEFENEDSLKINYLSPYEIRGVFHKIGIPLSNFQLTILLYYQINTMDDNGYIKYDDLIKIIFEQGKNCEIEEQKKDTEILQNLEKSEETQKIIEPLENTSEMPKFVELGEEHKTYAKEQLIILRDYIKSKNIGAKFQEDIENNSADDCIDPIRFIEILQKYDIKFPTPETIDVIYSYLKHPGKSEIYLDKFFTSIAGGDNLSQYLLKLISFVQKTEIQPITLMSKCIEESGSRLITKSALSKILQSIGYKFFSDELRELYASITVDGTFFGTFVKLLEQIYKRNIAIQPEKIPIFIKMHTEFMKSGVLLHELYKNLNKANDGYCEIMQFTEEIMKITNFEKSEIEQIFLLFDIYE